MNILVTGAKGFVGRNLVANLKNIQENKNRTRPNIVIENIFLTATQLDAIKQIKHIYKVTYENELLTLSYSGGKHNLISIMDFLKNEDIHFGQVYSKLPTLNDVFLEITGKELRD